MVKRISYIVDLKQEELPETMGVEKLLKRLSAPIEEPIVNIYWLEDKEEAIVLCIPGYKDKNERWHIISNDVCYIYDAFCDMCIWRGCSMTELFCVFDYDNLSEKQVEYLLKLVEVEV